MSKTAKEVQEWLVALDAATALVIKDGTLVCEHDESISLEIGEATWDAVECIRVLYDPSITIKATGVFYSGLRHAWYLSVVTLAYDLKREGGAKTAHDAIKNLFARHTGRPVEMIVEYNTSERYTNDGDNWTDEVADISPGAFFYIDDRGGTIEGNSYREPPSLEWLPPEEPEDTDVQNQSPHPEQ